MTEPANTETLKRRLTEAGLEPYIPVLIPLLKSSIGIVTQPTDERSLSIGASKFGGSPDLPALQLWPKLYSQPLDFIAQINLTEVTTCDVNHLLPISGILFFFHNESRLKSKELWNRSKGCVIYYDGAMSALERRQSPPKVYTYTACALTFAPDTNLPNYQDLLFNKVVEEMSDQHSEAYDSLVANLSVVSYANAKANRMLGHPDHIQGNPLLHAALFAQHEPIFEGVPLVDREWILLLQVDSDSNAKMFWGDYGTVYFCMLKEDLRRRNFSRVIVLTQST